MQHRLWAEPALLLVIRDPIRWDEDLAPARSRPSV